MSLAILCFFYLSFFFFFKQTTAYEIRLSLVGSEMCIGDSSMLQHNWAIDPDAVINRNKASIRAAKQPPLTSETTANRLPKNGFDCGNHCRDFFVSWSGWPPAGTIHLSHDQPLDSLLIQLNFPDSPTQPGVYTVTEHEIQDHDITSLCWLLGCHGNTDKENLKAAILEQFAWQQLLLKHPEVRLQLKYTNIRYTKGEPLPKEKRTSAIFLHTQRRFRAAVLKAIRQMYKPTRKMHFPLNRKLTVQTDTASPHAMVNLRSKSLTKKARGRQRLFLNTMKTEISINQIEDLNMPLYGGGPSLATHIAGMEHPLTKRPMFYSVDKSPHQENTFAFCFPSLHDDYAIETIGKLGIIMKARYGPTAWGPFHIDYRREQEASFTFNKTKKKWTSTEDDAQEEADKAPHEWMDNTGSDGEFDEDDDEEDEPICVIENLHIMVPGAYRTRSTLQMNEDASATTIAGLKAEEMSMMDSQVGAISEDGDRDPVDISTISKLYDQLQDIPGIPGMPGPVPSSQSIIKGATGAFIFESHCRLVELGRKNVPPTTPDYEGPYDDWNSLNSQAAMEHLHPVSEQRRMMWGMIKDEDTNPKEFFKRNELNDYRDVLSEHTMIRLRQDYPTPEYFALEEEAPVIALPVYQAGHPSRKLFKKYMKQNRSLTELNLFKNFELLHVFGLATYEVFPIDKEKCPMEEYAKTYGLTLTPQLLRQLQDNYIQILAASTVTFAGLQALKVSDQDDLSDDMTPTDAAVLEEGEVREQTQTPVLPRRRVNFSKEADREEEKEVADDMDEETEEAIPTAIPENEVQMADSEVIIEGPEPMRMICIREFAQSTEQVMESQDPSKPMDLPPGLQPGYGTAFDKWYSHHYKLRQNPSYEVQKKALMAHLISHWQLVIKTDPTKLINEVREEFFSDIKDWTYHNFWVQVSLSGLDFTLYCREVPTPHLHVPPADWNNCGLYDDLVKMVQEQQWLYDATYQDVETIPDLYWWSLMDLPPDRRLAQAQTWAWSHELTHLHELQNNLRNMFPTEQQEDGGL